MDKQFKEEIQARIDAIQAVWAGWHAGKIQLNESEFMYLDVKYWGYVNTIKKRLPQGFYQKAGGNPQGRSRGRPRKNEGRSRNDGHTPP